MLEARYADKGSVHLRLAVSTQHYAFSVQAFVNVVEACESEEYEFVLREATTAEIVDDVRTFRSEVGILYTDDFNRRVLRKAFDDADVTYFPCSTRACTCSWASTIRWPRARCLDPRT